MSLFNRLLSRLLHTGPYALAVLLSVMFLTPAHSAPPAPQDTLAQRLAACTYCHGEQGRAGPDGYYPRLAGKPAGYLYHQLLNFRDGRRQYRPMNQLLQNLDDRYLREMAEFFSAQKVPYPAPTPVALTPEQSQRARTLITQGDAPRKIPACASCHGSALMGALPATPALLGLPRDYLLAQLGAWQNELRFAYEPDCMRQIAHQLSMDDVATLSAWLSSQTVPASYTVVKPLKELPLRCGSAEH
jgi:cytochrome c553